MEELDLKELLMLFWNKKVKILLIVAIFMAIGIIYTIGFVTPVYTSSTSLVLATSNSSQQSSGTITTTDLTLNSNLVSTYRELVTSTSVVRQVISKETAEKMMDMLEYVVNDGTGKYAKIKGYSIGGKTGTSEPLSGSEDEGYVASFIAMSPTVNTQVVVLVTIYDPKGDSHQGSQVAGPVVKQILSEVLPYIGVAAENNEEITRESSLESKLLPDVRNKTIEEATEILKSAGFKVKITGDEDAATTLIIDQVPKPGVSLLENSTIYLYTANNNIRLQATVPDLKGKSSAQVVNSIQAANLNVIIDGSGTVVNQNVPSGKEVEQGTAVTVTMQTETATGY